MGQTSNYTPGFGIIVSASEKRELIEKLFNITLPTDEEELFEMLCFKEIKPAKYTLISLPHDISESFGSGNYVFIGVTGKPLETQVGYGFRLKQALNSTAKSLKEFEKDTKEIKRLEFGEGQMISWSKFKTHYDTLEEELKEKYTPIEGYNGELFFIPDDCLCCT